MSVEPMKYEGVWALLPTVAVEVADDRKVECVLLLWLCFGLAFRFR